MFPSSAGLGQRTGTAPTARPAASASSASRRPSLREPPSQPSARVHLAMQVIVTVAVLGVSLFVLLWRGASDSNLHWAYATTGMILGFWLKR